MMPGFDNGACMRGETAEDRAESPKIGAEWILLLLFTFLGIFMAASISYEAGSRSGAVAGWNYS
jgi:hypothetical protein